MALRNSRGGGGQNRPFVFPSLKVDGELWTEEVVIPNRGQHVMDAQQEAAAVIRQRRAAIAAANAAAEAAAAAVVPNDRDMADETSRNGEVLGAIRSDMESPAIDLQRVDSVIREWLAAHLPSTEQLFSASASLVGLQGIDQRVRDLVASFQEGLDSYRAAFTSWFEGVQGQWAALVATGEATLQQWSDQIAEVGRWRDDLEQRLFAAIADKVGPQGKVGPEGMAGTAVTVVDRLPKGKGPDFLFPYINRNAIVGDIAIDGTTDMRYAWRWTGQAWERGCAMTSLQVRDVRVQSLSTGNTVYPASTGNSGSGSTGSDPLMVRTAAAGPGSTTQIADSSRWSVSLKSKNLPSPTSARVALQLTAVDGAAAGKSLFVLAGLLYEPGGTASATTRYSEFSIMGDLKDNVEVDFTVQVQGAAAPSGISSSIPPGTTAAAIYLAVTRNTVGATRFITAGSVDWLLSQDINPDPSRGSLSPAWQV